MSRRKKIDLDAIHDEMGAVAAFARSNLTESDELCKDRPRSKRLPSSLAKAGSLSPNERRTILDGKYEVTVEWEHEPVIEGQANAATIRIVRANTWPAQPPERVAETLRIRVRHGTQVREFPLRTVSEQPACFVADFVPTRPGDYEITLIGTLEGQPLRESVDSGAYDLVGVRAAAEVHFPPLSTDEAQVPADGPKSKPTRQNSQAFLAVGFGIGFLSVLAALTSWRGRPGQGSVPVPLDDAGRRYEQQHPTGPKNSAKYPSEELEHNAGPDLQQEIILSIKPLVAEFRQELVAALQEQTRSAFRPVVTQGQ